MPVHLTTSDLPAWLVALIAFGFGAIWGSFFNVAIHRWPLGLSVVKPPSHCPHCHAWNSFVEERVGPAADR